MNLKRGGVRRAFSLLARKIVRSRLLIPVAAVFVASRVRPVNPGCGHPMGILILDKERWWDEDIEELGAHARLLWLSSTLRSLIISLFLLPEDMSGLYPYLFEGAARQRKDALISYLERLIPAVARLTKTQCLMTVNHMYLQNKPLAEACSRCGVPFIDLHKECMKDESVAQFYKEKYRKMNVSTRFLGTTICVYNQFMKRFFVDLGIALPEQVEVTGALRIDRFRRRVAGAATKPAVCRAVTLFSFRHIPAGADPREYVSDFSADGTKGYSRLFDMVHQDFARLAQQNPEIAFYIKLKWAKEWKKRIELAIRNCGIAPETIANLKIICREEKTAQELIMDSLAVTGLNSTTLLEARVAGKPVVLPYFAEIAERYPETLLFKDALPEFTVARSSPEFASALQSLIDRPQPAREMDTLIFKKYFGYSDGKSAERVIGAVRNAGLAA